jgi:hypothetical protein
MKGVDVLVAGRKEADAVEFGLFALRSLLCDGLRDIIRIDNL